jgi:bisphosphoglycerate-independent phosphoglycerate mutase (AlkP superfamily)
MKKTRLHPTRRPTRRPMPDRLLSKVEILGRWYEYNRHWPRVKEAIERVAMSPDHRDQFRQVYSDHWKAAQGEAEPPHVEQYVRDYPFQFTTIEQLKAWTASLQNDWPF